MSFLILFWPLPRVKELKKKEVQSSNSELDLFAPPPTAPVPQKKVKGKKALPNAPTPATKEGEGKEGLAQCPPPPAPVPQKKVKGKMALPSAPPVNPLTRRTIPSETTALGVGDWLTDKDILWWLNQHLCHMEIDEPRAWTMARLYYQEIVQVHADS